MIQNSIKNQSLWLTLISAPADKFVELVNAGRSDRVFSYVFVMDVD